MLLAVSPNANEIGVAAGNMAVRILKGEKPAGIPVRISTSFDVIINSKSAEHFKLSDAFLKTVTKKL